MKIEIMDYYGYYRLFQLMTVADVAVRISGAL
jgi:hypothetical protein